MQLRVTARHVGKSIRSRRLTVVVAPQQGPQSPPESGAPGLPTALPDQRQPIGLPPEPPSTSTEQTVTSDGGPLELRAGATTVRAPAGAIRAGHTLTVRLAPGAGPPGVPALGGGPFELSTSQGEPDAPVEVRLPLAGLLLASGVNPVLLHGDGTKVVWLPEITTISGGEAVASVRSFSPFAWVDEVTYAGGLLTGDRADMPADCISEPPSWIQNVALPHDPNQALPLCLATGTDDTHAELRLVNNRGYAQVVSITGATFDIQRSAWRESLEAQAAAAFETVVKPGDPQQVLIAAGSSVKLRINRPPDQPAARDVTLRADSKALTGYAAIAWAVLTTARKEIDLPVSAVNCLIGSAYNAAAADAGAASAASTMRSCANTAVGFRSVKAQEVFKRLTIGLIVDSVIYKWFDSQADAVYPPTMSFTIRGTGEVSGAIEVGPDNIGMIPAGQRSVVPLVASGGEAPYSIRLWAGRGGWPKWVKVNPAGELEITPPASAYGEFRLHVYAYDATGRHSPFARDTVTFSVFDPDPEAPPPPVAGPLRDVVQLASAVGNGWGGGTTCGRLSNGSVVCWGTAHQTEWPAPTSTNRPVLIHDLPAAEDVATGVAHGCALADQRVWCWGRNDSGQLGDGTTTSRFASAPVSTIHDALALSHPTPSCALRTSGTVACWGSNTYGQLGNASDFRDTKLVPAPVTGLTNLVEVASSGAHACARRADGTVWCWGRNSNGQVGIGGAGDHWTPQRVNGVDDALQLALGENFSCALRAGGRVSCWGADASGQLGKGTRFADSHVPVDVLNIDDAVDLTAGNWHACAVLRVGTVMCWGASGSGQLGDGSPIVSDSFPAEPVPVSVVGIDDALEVSAGNYHTCARRTTVVSCWGSNVGQLGDGTFISRTTPVTVLEPLP